MATTQKIPWPRIAAESLAIVASILLAFGIDAWWDGRERNQWELGQLDALRLEFEENYRILNGTIQTHEETERTIETIIAEVEPSIGKPITLDAYRLISLVSWRTTELTTGTLDALLSSGDLGQLSNAELRSALASWPSEVADALEDERVGQQFVELVFIPAVTGQGFLQAAQALRRGPGRTFTEEQMQARPTFTPTQELLELASVRLAHVRIAGGSLLVLRDQANKILQSLNRDLGSRQ